MNLFVRFITWNVGSGKDSTVLRALLEFVNEYNPVAIVLQEVADRSVMLRDFCDATDYRLERVHKGRHSSAVAVLIRGNLPDGGGNGFLMTPRRWVGRRVAGSKNDGWTKPKWTVYARTSFWDIKWVIASTHLTPSHHIRLARLLARVQVGVLAVWMRFRRRTVLLGGDFNETLTTKPGVLGPLKLVASVFTAPSHGSRAIDMWWLVIRRCIKKQKIVIKVEPLRGYPSDHRPVLLTMTKPVPELGIQI